MGLKATLAVSMLALVAGLLALAIRERPAGGDCCEPAGAVFADDRGCVSADPAVQVAPAPAVDSPLPSPRLATSSADSRPTSWLEPDARPPSLRGTEVDGALHVDEQGRFRPNADALDLFEYFFSATGEEPYEQLVARIIAEIHALIGGEAADQALAFLERYLEYRGRAVALRSARSGDDAIEPADLHEELRVLRREVFGAEEAAILFREAEPAERRARARVVRPTRLAREVEHLRREGVGEQEIRRLRERRVGSAAAERLAGLDRERDVWRQRLADYRTARAALQASASLTAAERRAALDALLVEHFSAAERRRVEALDRIAADAER
jgi:lipase chaperone LimK